MGIGFKENDWDDMSKEEVKKDENNETVKEENKEGDN